MERSEDHGREPGAPRDHRFRPHRADRPLSPGTAGAATRHRASRAPGAWLIAACAGVIVFVVLAVYGAVHQLWPLFFAGCVLTALTAAFAIVEAERWRRGDDPGPGDHAL
ncbi:hypothetical protein AB0O34_17175 [Sphaerisporangium sp. NPDC088356]|uniref:hypothetical protein n=1 Tax=Sphaerisporangium sp. NPDC088356 TaxID=3154871 RepID=UPI0034133BEC